MGAAGGTDGGAGAAGAEGAEGAPAASKPAAPGAAAGASDAMYQPSRVSAFLEDEQTAPDRPGRRRGRHLEGNGARAGRIRLAERLMPGRHTGRRQGEELGLLAVREALHREADFLRHTQIPRDRRRRRGLGKLGAPFGEERLVRRRPRRAAGERQGRFALPGMHVPTIFFAGSDWLQTCQFTFALMMTSPPGKFAGGVIFDISIASSL